MKNQLEGLDLATFISRHPHNSDTSDRFVSLIELCYRMDTRGLSLDEFVQDCLYHYGGTIAGAMIDYLINHI